MAYDWLKGIEDHYDVVVIGSGLGGLTGANVLAKCGHKVLLLEHHYQLGGLATGHAAPIDNVAVGSGQMDWSAILKTAQDVGVKHYFIEDETPTPLICIPDSLKYLRALKL